MKSLLKKKGFTLIEVLIVVVIIGILASLILPRMLAQPERAITAEALNYLGVIRRALNVASQPGSQMVSTELDTITSGGANGSPTPGKGWRSLGLDSLPTGTRFTYSCLYTPDDPATTPANEEAGSCTAKRNKEGARSEGTIKMDVSTGFISGCGGGTTSDNAYTLRGTSNTATATCI